MSLLYLLFLVFILLQRIEDVRSLLGHIDNKLNHTLPEKSYATDCRLYTPEKDNKYSNIKDAVFDEFLIAHSLGWFGKVPIYQSTFFVFGFTLSLTVISPS